MPPEIAKEGDKLYIKWEQNWEGLGSNQTSEEEISAEIALTRKVVVNAISNLE